MSGGAPLYMGGTTARALHGYLAGGPGVAPGKVTRYVLGQRLGRRGRGVDREMRLSNRRRSAGPDQPAGSAPGSADQPSIINAASDRRSWRAWTRRICGRWALCWTGTTGRSPRATSSRPRRGSHKCLHRDGDPRENGGSHRDPGRPESPTASRTAALTAAPLTAGAPSRSG
ncbi:hypothetical protein SRO_2559 [Streptomyces rochei]|nr:hypothetical protein SRO_2559 [Streptomyces rochei]